MLTIEATPQMWETITVLRMFVQNHGHVPSVRELAPLLGMSPMSVSSARRRLAELDEAGVIYRMPFKDRAYGFRPGVIVVYHMEENPNVQEESLS